MAAVNAAVSGMETFFAAPDPSTWTISSRMVRELVAQREFEAASQLVPEEVRTAIQQLSSG